jgi:hypothetical protein
MRNLLRRLLGNFEEPEGEREFTADQIKPFFEANGINIETIGFPLIKTRNLCPTESYWITFSDVQVTPLRVGKEIQIQITGNYRARARASYKHKDGHWRPGVPCEYKFQIEDGKLNIRETN